MTKKVFSERNKHQGKEECRKLKDKLVSYSIFSLKKDSEIHQVVHMN